MMGVALPSIRSDLGMSTSSLQWVVSGYVLGYGGFLLLGGRAADLLGRRRVFLVSLAVFLVASGLGGLADDGNLLIATRFIKGISAAFTAPAGLSIITTSFAEGPARNKALVDLHRHRGRRLLARARLRRPPDRVQLALGLLPARAARARHPARRHPPRPGLRPAGPPPARSTSPGRSAHRGDAAAGLHAGRGARRRVGLGRARIGSLVASAAILAALRRRSSGGQQHRWSASASCAPARCVRANLGAMALIGAWFGCPVHRHAVHAAAARLVGPGDGSGGLPGRADRRPAGAAHRAPARSRGLGSNQRSSRGWPRPPWHTPCSGRSTSTPVRGRADREKAAVTR